MNILDYALALISGVLLALSFPEFGNSRLRMDRARAAPVALHRLEWPARTHWRGAALRALVLSLVTCTVFFIGHGLLDGQRHHHLGDVPVAVAAIGVVLMCVSRSITWWDSS